MFYEASIRECHAGFGMYQATKHDEGWEMDDDLMAEINGSISGLIYELGVDDLPEGLEDIRGRIYNEPDRVFGYFWHDNPEEPTYFGIVEDN